MSSSPDLVSVITSLGRHTTWSLDSMTPIAADVGHPQGLTAHGDDWLASTVLPSSRRGLVLRIDTSGAVVQTLDVTDGDRFHPGGIHSSGPDDNLWIPVAEYRPFSTSTVIELNADLEVVSRFPMNDHLGAICDLGDGTLFAVSWGSRSLYRLSREGVVLDHRTNPSHVIDYQDLQVIGPGIVLASGVADMTIAGTAVQMGGVAVLDMEDLRIVHEVPITAVMPSGRSITYNGFCVDTRHAAIKFQCLVDDSVAAIGHWSAT
jgi:hypothetical protein